MAASAERLPQHLTALRRANEIRLERAAVKRRLFAGTATVADVLKVHEIPGVDTLEDVDSAVATMTVRDLLSAQRRWGIVRVRKLLAAIPLAEHIRLGDLTSRQRRALARAIEDRLDETSRDAQLVRARRLARERMEAAQRARRERERREAVAAAAREAEAATAAAAELARFPAVLRVECPHCRSAPGDECSVYDPVRDHWHVPKDPHGERYTAAGLPRP